jgi:beta-1,4-N-acetylglucosaminyltransferase
VIFVTVGSMFQFDRLIRAVDELVGEGLLTGDVLAQIGHGLYEPRHMAFDRFLAKPAYDLRVDQAAALIGHAGAGTIALALERHKPLLAVPRRQRYAESVNDHQIVTARKFGALGHILVADDVSDIRRILPQLYVFTPKVREARPHDLALRIGAFLESLSPRD